MYKRKVKGKIYAGRKQATQASSKGVAPQEGVTELTGKGQLCYCVRRLGKGGI